MTPYEQIWKKYREEMPEVDFSRIVGHHLQFGFAFGTPDFFVMGRPVVKDAPESQIDDPYHLFPPATADAWYVHAMAGNIEKAWSILPWPLGFIGFHRNHGGIRELTFCPTEVLKRLSVNAASKQTLAA